MAGQRPPDNPARRVRPAGQWEVFCSRHALHAEREGHSLPGIRTYGDEMPVKIMSQYISNRVVHQDQHGFADSDTVITVCINIVPALSP
jgi:hypothetical protein